jgi:hypothetical protein
MSRSSARRAQTELGVLAAVFAVCAGLTLYVGVLDATLPGDKPAETPRIAADRAADLARVGGTVRPGRLGRASAAAPNGHRLNATLVASGRRWSTGPPVPDRARTVTRRVSVRVGPGRVRPGELRIAVWR